VAHNCDWTVAIDRRVARCGGVICGCESNFKAVFSLYISLIRIESDSSIAIKLIKDGCPKKHQSFQLVQDIHRIYKDERMIMWNYERRQTKRGYTNSTHGQVFHIRIYL